MDNNYQTYLNRVARMVLPQAYSTQVGHIQESSKFKQTDSRIRQAVSFPGYTLITPPQEEDSENSAFYTKLQDYQRQLLELYPDYNLIVPLRAASFHLTIADLIWDSAYRDVSQKNLEFDAQLSKCFHKIFQNYQQSVLQLAHPICWQMLGLIVMPRAIAVCLIPKNESSYEQIVNLRRTIYQNPQLIALGIEQHYHFTAHITLGYFADIPPTLDRAKLATLLSDLNRSWIDDTLELLIHRIELRKFDDMTHFYRQPDWPFLKL